MQIAQAKSRLERHDTQYHAMQRHIELQEQLSGNLVQSAQAYNDDNEPSPRKLKPRRLKQLLTLQNISPCALTHAHIARE